MSLKTPLVVANGLTANLQSGDLIAPGIVTAITNSDLVTQSAGMIVRSSAAGFCMLAQADTEGHAINILGARVNDVLSGAVDVVSVFQPGLRVRLVGAATAGEQIYLSATTAGCGVNVAPTLPVLLGTAFNTVNIGGIWYADLVPYQPQPVVGFSDVRWTTAFNVDFSTLTNQNLMTGGDGVKTLSNGSQVYVANTARASNLSIINGSGLHISALGTNNSSDSTAPTAYWRMENLGNAALNRREWTTLRCSMIASSVRPVQGSVAFSSVGGFYAVPAGNIVNGIPSWTFSTGTWISCQSRNWYNAGVSYEGAPYMGSGVTANQRTDNGYVLAAGAVPRNLYVIIFTRAEILIWLNTSVGSDFPDDVLAGATLIGTYRPANVGSYDVTAVLAAAWEVNGAGGQNIYVTKMRCEYK